MAKKKEEVEVQEEVEERYKLGEVATQTEEVFIDNETESNYTHHRGERAILYWSIEHVGTKMVNN